MEEHKQPSALLSLLLVTLFTGGGFIAWYFNQLITLVILFILLSGGIVYPFLKPTKKKWLYIGFPLIGLLFSSVFSFFGFGYNHESSGPTLEQKADSGDPNAQYSMGLISLFTKNDKTANYLLSSAQQGNAKAQFMLGALLANNKHELAKAHAYKWFLLAKRSGYDKADEGISLLMETITPKDKALGEELANKWAPLTSKSPNNAFKRDAEKAPRPLT